MPPPAQRLRPHTFFGRVPQGVCNVDICKVLVTRFSKNELSGVQDFGGGRFEVTFKSKPAVQRFLSDPVIEVRGTAVRFAYRGTLSTVVRVFGFPVDIDVAELRGALEQYGPVESIALEYVPGFDGVPSGTRRVRMEMKSALPNFLQVAEFTVQCEYEGVARVCRRCGSRDHVRAACDVPLCARCGVFGHATCELPCPQCGGDHAVAKCATRTFASVAKRAMVAAAAAAASQVPVAPEKTSDPVPATEDAVSSGPAAAENSQDDIEEPTGLPEPAGLPGQHGDEENEPRTPPGEEEGFTVVARRKRRRGRGTSLAGGTAAPSEGSSAHCGAPAKLKRRAPQRVSSPLTGDDSGQSEGEASRWCESCSAITNCDCSILSDNTYSSDSDEDGDSGATAPRP
ncbi:uncharacterized protein LOC144094319 [Amblyomma americanum]